MSVRRKFSCSAVGQIRASPTLPDQAPDDFHFKGGGTRIMQFDMLIKGGEVVDPGSGRVGQFDVAIKRNRIAAVDVGIPAESAVQVIDAREQYVTPGLVDMHTHVY